MTPLEISLLVVVVLLVATSAYLAAAETVVTRIDVVRALRLEEEEMAGASALLWVTRRRAMSGNVLLVVKVAVRMLMVALATVLGLSLGAGTMLPLVLGLVGLGLVVLVAAEIAPRTLVLRHLETTGLRLAASIRVMVTVFDPVAQVLVAAGRVLVPHRGEISGPFASDDELRSREVDDGGHEELEPEERAMIHSIFELADTKARTIMTPRPDIVMVASDAPLREVVDLVLEHGTSRLPVYAPDDHGRVVGIVHAKDLLGYLADKNPPDDAWHERIREPLFVPETKRCDELLRDLRAGAIHLAVVVDEHGEFIGLVTIEDILEEIVGEIVDEHDQEEPLVATLPDGGLQIDARLGVNDLNELLGTALPEEGWDTVGGLVYATLGRIPTAGESIELDGITILVEDINGRRIGKVQVRRREVASQHQDARTVEDDRSETHETSGTCDDDASNGVGFVPRNGADTADAADARRGVKDEDVGRIAMPPSRQQGVSR